MKKEKKQFKLIINLWLVRLVFRILHKKYDASMQNETNKHTVNKEKILI